MTEQPMNEERAAAVSDRLLEVWISGFKSGIASLLHDQGFPDDFGIEIGQAMTDATVGDPAVVEVVLGEIRDILMGASPAERVKTVQSFSPLVYPEFPDMS